MKKYELIRYRPGCLSALCSLQAEYYARKWELSQYYESVVAKGVAEFLLRYDPDKDFTRVVIQDGNVVGGVVIDSRDGVMGQLRWFFLAESLHGLGLGAQLISDAMAFVNSRNFEKIFLTTIAGLDAARRLYDRHGFNVVEEKVATTWGRELTEHRMEWRRN